MIPYNKKLVGVSQELRKNMTPEEKHLWYDFLKKLPFPVKRQKNIGNYIVDFYIPSTKTVIEIDGRQHLLPEHKAEDAERDKYLSSLGITVLRYKNSDVNGNFTAVTNDVLKNLNISYNNL